MALAFGIYNKDFCDSCIQSNAPMQCVFCQVQLCQTCSKYHDKIDLRKHLLVQCDAQKCEVHQQEVCTHRCNDCHKFRCFLCVLSEQEKGHLLVPIRNVSRMRFESFKQIRAEHIYALQKEKELVTMTRSFPHFVDVKYLHEQEKNRNQISCSGPVSSKELNVLFGSFEVDFPPDDPTSESFAREILGKHSLKDLVTYIQSLSNRIVLAKHCVFEVEVVNDEDHLNVVGEVGVNRSTLIEKILIFRYDHVSHFIVIQIYEIKKSKFNYELK